MYIELTNAEKNQYAIHANNQDIQNIYESLVFMSNIEKDHLRKKQIQKQFQAIEQQIPNIEF